MELDLKSTTHIQTEYQENYYGEDGGVFADIHLMELIINEIPEISDRLTVIFHPGIAQQLKLGNSSGIMDQYIGSYFYGPVEELPDNYGIMLLSSYSPWSIFVHELGHHLKLYDQYYEGHMGKYCMMGTGTWHTYQNESSPADFSSGMKYKLGWLGYYNITPGIYLTHEFDIGDSIKIGTVFIEYLSIGEIDTPGIVISNLLGHKLMLVDFISSQGVVQIYDLIIQIRLDGEFMKITFMSSDWGVMNYLKEGSIFIAFLLTLPIINRLAGRKERGELFE